MNILKTLTTADSLTLGGAAAGFLSILLLFQQRVAAAAIFLVVASIFDWADGKIARLQKAERLFGKELDSLADGVSFGVAPALFGYVQSGSTPLAGVLSALFLFCGIARLARFNITKNTGSFEGVPITINGLLFPLLFRLNAPPAAYLATFVIMGGLMISTILIKKRW